MQVAEKQVGPALAAPLRAVAGGSPVIPPMMCVPQPDGTTLLYGFIGVWPAGKVPSERSLFALNCVCGQRLPDAADQDGVGEASS
jgi:hypothetical protein